MELDERSQASLCPAGFIGATQTYFRSRWANFLKNRTNFFVKRQTFARSLSLLLLVWGKCWSKLFSNTWWCISVGLPLNFSWADVNINWFNGRCWAIMFIILTDVIAKNCGRSCCQFLGRCYCPYIWGGNISLVWQILGQCCLMLSWLMLLPWLMADLVAKFVWGWCYCPCVLDVGNTL